MSKTTGVIVTAAVCGMNFGLWVDSFSAFAAVTTGLLCIDLILRD